MPATDHDNRLLLVLPSWVGDACMVTPALVNLREALPGAFIGAMARPGIDRLLDALETPAGRPVIDEFHTVRPSGVMGPKHAAARVRPRRYARALLFTGSFSTALAVRVAGIPERIGYDRDGRGFLLTRRLKPPRTPKGDWAVVPAVSYYWHATHALLDPSAPPALAPPTLDDPRRVATGLPENARMTLPVTEADRAEADAVGASASIAGPTAILNPGGNNPAKRWSVQRFAALADHLARAHGLTVLINGSPAEAELCRAIAEAAETDPVVLPDHGHTLGALKALAADARVMVTNDTGPRHIAACVGTPLVSLFGPTDPRWTTIPVPPEREAILVADPSLPVDQISNDHPDRCAIDNIPLDAVVSAADGMLAES
jgi:heptosyltransferase-2